MRRFVATRLGVVAGDQLPPAEDHLVQGVVFHDGRCFTIGESPLSCSSPTFESAMQLHGVTLAPHYGQAAVVDEQRVFWIDDGDTPMLSYADGLQSAAILAELNMAKTGSGFVAQLVDELKTAAMESRA